MLAVGRGHWPPLLSSNLKGTAFCPTAHPTWKDMLSAGFDLVPWHYRCDFSLPFSGLFCQDTLFGHMVPLLQPFSLQGASTAGWWQACWRCTCSSSGGRRPVPHRMCTSWAKHGLYGVGGLQQSYTAPEIQVLAHNGHSVIADIQCLWSQLLGQLLCGQKPVVLTSSMWISLEDLLSYLDS